MQKIINELRKYSDSKKAKVLQGFFKTGKGQYGEGEVFIGVIMPDIRKVAKKFVEIELSEVEKLLQTKVHEQRMCALVIGVEKFKKGDEKIKKEVYDLFFRNMKYINNWDLVDVNIPHVFGAYLFDKDRKILYKLAKSKDLWEKRIAMLSTYYFIRNKDFKDALNIAEILLEDDHDLIHKAVGWMLREVGNMDQTVEEKFLQKYYKKMPRTMLRYAIEKFEEEKRLKYLKGKV